MNMLPETLASWVDGPSLDRWLIEGLADLDEGGALHALTVIGRLLRCPAASLELRRALRDWLAGHLSEREVALLESGLALRGDSAAELAELLLHGPESVSAAADVDLSEEAVCLVQALDDMESLEQIAGFLAVRRASLNGATVVDEHLHHFRAAATAWAERFETLSSELIPALEQRLAAVSTDDIPRALFDVLDVEGNPWWLELVDPERRRWWQRPALRLKAAEGKPIELVSENGAARVNIATRDGTVMALVEPPDWMKETGGQLLWLEGQALVQATLSPYSTKLLQATLPSTILSATEWALEMGGQRWDLIRTT